MISVRCDGRSVVVDGLETAAAVTIQAGPSRRAVQSAAAAGFLACYAAAGLALGLAIGGQGGSAAEAAGSGAVWPYTLARLALAGPPVVTLEALPPVELEALRP